MTATAVQILLNPAVRRDPAFTGPFTDEEHSRVQAFFDGQPHFPATPLRVCRQLAADLGIDTLLVKDETARFGIEAFKILGVRFATAQLSPAILARGLVCATAGNHGRAVARVARDRGVPCTVFVPAPHPGAAAVELATRLARVSAMRADGATVVDVDGSYEEAVARAAAHGEAAGATVVSDTSWPGYETIPRAIMLGYSRLFHEASRQWDAPPDLIVVQAGVGGLVCAAASWFARYMGAERPTLVACEPTSSACLLESARAGGMVDLEKSVRPQPEAGTVMAGLRCAAPSPAAWPTILEGVDAFVAIPDGPAIEAMDILRRADASGGDTPIHAGPSGACGVGALMALARDPAGAAFREQPGLGRSTRVMAIVTEGP